MCARFELNASARETALQFSLAVDPESVPGPVLRPTDPILVIGSGRVAKTLRWGLQVSWSPRPLINARSETLREKPSFRSILANRVLVPATAYIEWKETGHQGKVRYRIAPERNAPFAMAGLVDGDRVTIITCAPSPAVAEIHDRMPVILADQDKEQAWLENCPPEEVLLPYAGSLRAQPDPEPKAQGDLFA